MQEGLARKLHPLVASQRPCPHPGSLRFFCDPEPWSHSQNGVPENLTSPRTVDFMPDYDPGRSTSLLGFSVAVGRPGRQGDFASPACRTVLDVHLGKSDVCDTDSLVFLRLRDRRPTRYLAPFQRLLNRVSRQALMNLYQPTMSQFVRNCDLCPETISYGWVDSHLVVGNG